MGRQLADDLLVELGPVAAGDDGDLGDGEKVCECFAHRWEESLLALGGGAVEVEGDEGDHCGQKHW